MKTIRVVAAVIQRKQNGSKQIFATQRGYGKFEGGWEFPGGKIEVGETPQKALIREIKEELDADIVVGDLIDTIEFDYPDFHLSMDCFWCELQSEHVVLNEHEDAKWLSRAQLDSVDWLPADVTLVDKIAKGM
jgi:8-oxo-dGTP diphosphatase